MGWVKWSAPNKKDTDGFASRLGQMNLFVIKVGSKPYILSILFPFCYFSTLKVGKKHLKIE